MNGIIFDWDDTLLSTFWIIQLGLIGEGPFTEEFAKHCELLEKSINSLIREARKYGCVYIVTNAEHAWIEYSIARYVPGVILDDVTVVATIPGIGKDPQHNKNAAFLNIIKELNPKSLTVIGDSCYEHTALEFIKKFMPRRIYRSIKFIENPSCADLIKQHAKCMHTLKFIMGLECNWYEIYNL